MANTWHTTIHPTGVSAQGKLPTSEIKSSQSPPPSFLAFQPVTQDDIRHILSAMGPSSSLLDPLPTTVIQSLIDELLPDLTALVNSSLASGEVPDAWKIGMVTPLLKKEGADPQDVKNLRPVTQLRLLPRLTEAVVARQIQGHLEHNHLLHDLQSGFRPERGTELATADIREHLLWCADRNHPVILILLDLSAAFDTVDHEILLQRLVEVGGFGGKALDWIQSFLTNRSQIVKWEDLQSSEAKVPWGVPQGSSLSPVLFNVYLRPLATLLESAGLRFHMYADDTQILVDLHEEAGERERLAPCLTLLREWMRQSKLCLNEAKTELLAVGGDGSGFPEVPWPASWGTPPTPVLRIRNLGVEISHRLDGAAQAAKTSKACHHQMNSLARIFPLLNIGQRKHLCQALIGSRINYGLVFLLGASRKTLFSLQKTQNRAIRLIYNLDRRQHLSQWRLRLGWLTIESLIKLRICIWLWKARRQLGPGYAQNWARKYASQRSRRCNAGSLLPPPKFKKSTKGGHTIASQGSRIWNSLPCHLRGLDSLTIFKKNLKLFLLQEEAQQKNIATCNGHHGIKPKQLEVRPPEHKGTAPLTMSSQSAPGPPAVPVCSTVTRLSGSLTNPATNPHPLYPLGLHSPPLPARNNRALIFLAERNKALNCPDNLNYAPRKVGPSGSLLRPP